MFRFVRLSALFLLIFLCGCDGSGVINPNPNPNPNSPVTVTPTNASVPVGQATVLTVGVQSLTIPANPVQLSVTGLPANATAIFNPPQISPINNVLNGTSVLTISTAASTPPGTYPLTIQGAVGAAVFGTAQATLIVTTGGGGQNFTLNVTPGSALVNSSTPATFTATVTRTGGVPFTSPINITISGGGLDYNVSNPSPSVLNLSSQNSASSVFNVSQVIGSTPTAPTTFTVTATGGGVTQTQTITVQTP